MYTLYNAVPLYIHIYIYIFIYLSICIYIYIYIYIYVCASIPWYVYKEIGDRYVALMPTAVP